MPPRRLIVGLSGPALLPAERAFLLSAEPAGVILFARNCVSRDQIKRLTNDVRAARAGPCLVLVDEEGGRVQRLRPPVGRTLPPASAFLAAHDGNIDRASSAARRVARLTAQDLRALGIDTNCAPVADLRLPGMHAIVGDRAYGQTAHEVAALAAAVAAGFMAGAVLPVVKHIPGHGRARCDSHFALPVVDTALDELARTDFAAFTPLSHLPAAMTAHVVYTALDREAPATVSLPVIGDVIRRQIGFGGLLMTDDLSMKALSGTLPERAAAALSAGCDIALHCNGNLEEMEAVAAVCPHLEANALSRFERAVAVTAAAPTLFDEAGALAECAAALSAVRGGDAGHAGDPTA